MKLRQQPAGNKNIIGAKVVALRSARGIKQKEFLAHLQVLGMNISATGLSRLEGQYRLVQDYEVVTISQALNITVGDLLTKPINELLQHK